MKIEKNIPTPETLGGGARKKYPFDEMKIGDSIFIEGQVIQGGAFSSARYFEKKLGIKFTARSVDGGVRIWRIA